MNEIAYYRTERTLIGCADTPFKGGRCNPLVNKGTKWIREVINNVARTPLERK